METSCPEITVTTIGVESKLQSVIIDLNQLITVTEEKYSYIYECLPEIEQEVGLSVREVEILLNYLIYKFQESKDFKQSVILETLLGLLGEFEEVTECFLNKELVSVLMHTFLDNSGGDKQSFSELINVAHEVEETLSVLRDLALNSIIFSVRIGEQGAAFQILSDRINQVSLGLGLQFGSMKETINSLNDWNQEFQKTLTEFINYEENLNARYTNKFQNEFQHISAVLKTACIILENNLANTNTAFGGVGEIMVMIQNQDIIRQNVENLIKCLDIVREKRLSYDFDSKEHFLDYIVFANKVLELSKTLLDNIEISLNESIFGIGTKLTEMHETLMELEEDSYYLSKLLVGSEENIGYDCVLGDIFKTVLGQVVDLIYIKKHIDSKSNMLMDSRQKFIELMDIVETEFANINREAKNLKKMKILIQIELARINLEKDFTLDSIIDAVDQVIDTIKQNQQLFLQLRNYFMKNINEFNEALNMTRNKLESSAFTLENSKAKVEITGKLATGAVIASGHEMNEIFERLKQPWQRLTDNQSLANLINGIKTEICQIHQELKQIQDHVFAQNGITYWEEKEEDLKLLMDQFTCYVERKAMTAVIGVNNQDIGSNSGGDIVLF